MGRGGGLGTAGGGWWEWRCGLSPSKCHQGGGLSCLVGQQLGAGYKPRLHRPGLLSRLLSRRVVFPA